MGGDDDQVPSCQVDVGNEGRSRVSGPQKSVKSQQITESTHALASKCPPGKGKTCFLDRGRGDTTAGCARAAARAHHYNSQAVYWTPLRFYWGYREFTGGVLGGLAVACSWSTGYNLYYLCVSG